MLATRLLAFKKLRQSELLYWALPLEGIKVGFVTLWPGLARFAIAAGAVALDVAQVLGKRLRAGVALIDQQGLDRHAPGHRRQFRAREARRRMAASQARAGPLANSLALAAGCCEMVRRGLAAAGFVNLRKHLGNEALALVSA